MELENILETAKQAAVSAGRIHMYYLGKDKGVESKENMAHNKVTQVDVESERCIVDIISKRYPEHAIAAEEGTGTESTSPWKWFIDPLDGTNNYIKGYPAFCVSVGVSHGNDLKAGVVYDAFHDELFYAASGQGAFLNGTRIQVNKTAELSDALLVTGFFYDRGKAMRRNLDRIGDLFEQRILGIRRSGSAALDLCHTACGRADGFFEHRLNSWDFAAGVCILAEAGGLAVSMDGSALQLKEGSVLASNPVLLEKMKPFMVRDSSAREVSPADTTHRGSLR